MVERILTSRLGIRILAEHHIGLRNERVCSVYITFILNLGRMKLLFVLILPP